MTLAVLALMIALLTGLSACGGAVDVTCDDVRTYQTAVPGKRVKSPDDLDDLDLLREMPLPEASPQPPRPAGSECIDRPPAVRIGSE